MLRTAFNIVIGRRAVRLGSELSYQLGHLRWKFARRVDAAHRAAKDRVRPVVEDLKETALPRKLERIPVVGHGLYVTTQFTLNLAAVAIEDAIGS